MPHVTRHRRALAVAIALLLLAGGSRTRANAEEPADAGSPPAASQSLISFRRDKSVDSGTPAESVLPAISDQPAATGPVVSAPASPHLSSAPPAAPPARAELSVPRNQGRALDTEDRRRLAPRGSSSHASAPTSRPSLAERLPVDIDRGTLTTTAAALGLVIGLLLVGTWILKRAGPPATGALPPEAFMILGRTQLPDRTTIQLMRLGSKLVLVATTADGLQPLTEITDPTEVDRLAGICSQGSRYGPAAEFQQVLQQLAREPARGLLDREGRRT